MKGSSMFVPGFCAGVLMVLVALAFAVGAAAKERPLREARGAAQANANANTDDASTGITIVFYPTATPTAHEFAAVDLSTARPTVTQTVPATPATTVTSTQTATATLTPSLTPTSACSGLSTVEDGFSYWREEGCFANNATLSQVFTGTKMCPIERNSCPYSYLAGNLAPGIVFQREEAPPLDEEDQLMHPAMLAPLARLQKKAFAEWKGRYVLVVVDAYESADKSNWGIDPDWRVDRQGQLVVLSLWPRAETETFKNDIGRLCALALGAEFDWVGRRDTNCLAAVKAPSLCNVCRPTPTGVPSATMTPTVSLTLTPTPTITGTLVTAVTTPTLTPEWTSTLPPPAQPPPTSTSPTPQP